MTIATGSSERSQRGKEVAFAFAVVSFFVVFLFLIPFLTYVCDIVLHVHGMVIPPGTSQFLAVPWWVPITIAALGIGSLIWFAKANPAGPKLRWSIAAIGFVVLVGGLWCLALSVPVISLLNNLSAVRR